MAHLKLLVIISDDIMVLQDLLGIHCMSHCVSWSYIVESRWLQVCAQCGETNTPTWRRAGGQLLCNACGLRRYRAMARSNKGKLGAGAGASPPHDGRCSPDAM